MCFLQVNGETGGELCCIITSIGTDMAEKECYPRLDCSEKMPFIQNLINQQEGKKTCQNSKTEKRCIKGEKKMTDISTLLFSQISGSSVLGVEEGETKKKYIYILFTLMESKFFPSL